MSSVFAKIGQVSIGLQQQHFKTVLHLCATLYAFLHEERLGGGVDQVGEDVAFR